MIKRLFSFIVTDRDYFDHFRSNPDDGQKVHTFSDLKEAFLSWKLSKSKDFCWEDDHERETSQLKKSWVYVPETQPKHGEVLGYKPMTDEEEIKLLFSNPPTPCFDMDGEVREVKEMHPINWEKISHLFDKDEEVF